MSPSITRLIGILFILSAAILMVLNLKRVADAKTFWVGIPLLIIGLALVARSRRDR